MRFAKYEAAGNDFVIVDGRGAGAGDPAAAWPALARRMCDRHYGIGADGLLVASVPGQAGAAHRMRMFNPDGSEAEMCGNGLRCYARWLHERGEIGRRPAPVETGAGVLLVEVGEDSRIAATMGPPRLAPAAIPLSAEAAAGQPAGGPVLRLPLRLPNVPEAPASSSPGAHLLEATCVSMGNPHAVVFVPDVDAVPLETVGPHVERHAFFPARTNLEVCQVLAPDRLRVRVWERGAGMTLACGTGACAAMVAARLRGYARERVAVELPGGEVEVEWLGAAGATGATGATGAIDDQVVLRGGATHVFDGDWLKG